MWRSSRRSTDHPFQAACDSLWLSKFVLPYSNDLPTPLPKLAPNQSISVSVSFQLPRPERAIAGWHTAVLWTAVPETSIYKNRHACRREGEIRVSENASVAPPTLDAMISKNADEAHLGRNVAAALDPRHD
jgi:hypothetical protein